MLNMFLIRSQCHSGPLDSVTLQGIVERLWLPQWMFGNS